MRMSSTTTRPGRRLQPRHARLPHGGHTGRWISSGRSCSARGTYANVIRAPVSTCNLLSLIGDCNLHHAIAASSFAVALWRLSHQAHTLAIFEGKFMQHRNLIRVSALGLCAALFVQSAAADSLDALGEPPRAAAESM